MESEIKTVQRSRTVRHCVTANAFRAEPAGFRRAVFGFLLDDGIALIAPPKTARLGEEITQAYHGEVSLT